MRRPGGDGIRLDNAVSGPCSGNTCAQNGRHGVAVLGASTSTLESNTATENTGAGFHVRSAAPVTFARTNTATDNQQSNFDPPTLVKRSWW